MTTPALQAEADRVELVYYWAINQLGNAMAVDALEAWKQVPATPAAAHNASWLATLIRLLFGVRSEAHDLGVAYYRLVRALRTGFTVAIDGETGMVSLEHLRQQFEEIVDHIDTETGGTPPPRNLHVVDEDVDIAVEDLGDINDIINASNDDAMQEAGTVLDALGIENFISKLDGIDPEAPDRDEQIAQAFEDAGNRQAAAAMRIAMNAARGLTYDLASTDLRILGWARYSTTGTPCGWCAMLISRGAVYRTRKSASSPANGPGEAISDTDKYHDNCHCIAVPVFLRDQYDNSSLFDLNREYARLWPIVTKGLHGKDALTEWRRYFRSLGVGEQALSTAA